MDCKEAKKQCQPFLDGQLQTDVVQQVDAHLEKCPGCKDVYDSQRTFHTLLKKVVVRSADPVAVPALKKSLLERLNAGHTGKTIDASALFRAFSPNVRAMPVRQSVAAAAACMFMLSGVVGFQTMKVSGQCKLVCAAQHEHDNIVAGNRVVLASSHDSKVLDSAFKKFRLAEWLKTVPNLEGCDFDAQCCGKVKLPGLPDGVYVQYAQCKGTHEPMTLMVIDTPESPNGESYKDLITAQHVDHTVVSWHAENNGPLYILVTKLPFNDTLNAAESIRIAKR